MGLFDFMQASQPAPWFPPAYPPTPIPQPVAPLLPPPVSPAEPPQMAKDVAWHTLAQPFVDAYRAARGQMSDLEAKDFAVTAAMGLIPMKAAQAVKGIRAYHGSPHDFDHFDMSKINTGQAAQTYGHGLYFAENEAVARSYRDALAMKTQDMPGFRASTQLKLSGGDREAAIQELLRDQRRFLPDSQAAKDAGEAVRLLREGMEVPKGRMYEVNINAKPEQFLDWDKPLSKQPSTVSIFRKAGVADLSQELPQRLTGADLYRYLASQEGGQKTVRTPVGEYQIPFTHEPMASDRLREAGIPGIKYLDEGSRGVGQGTSNYVLFRDDIIDIVKKYGWAALAPLLGAQADQIAIPKQQAPVF